MTVRLLVACDFDGTVTHQDTLVEILNRFGASDWARVQRRVVSGEISIREGLQAEMSSVRATPAELRQLLVSRIEMDPGFGPFLRRVRAQGIPLVILSGGFDLCVEAVLGQAGLWPVPFLANRLRRANSHWEVEFPYPSPSCTDCGHCKADPIRGWTAQGYDTVFVGNGVTDRCAARAATLTFAKGELAQWCRREGIPAVSYETFDDVCRELEARQWL